MGKIFFFFSSEIYGSLKVQRAQSTKSIDCEWCGVMKWYSQLLVIFWMWQKSFEMPFNSKLECYEVFKSNIKLKVPEFTQLLK